MAKLTSQTPDNAYEAEPEQTSPPALLDIGALSKAHHLSPAAFAGVCAANNWKPGKQLTDKEFVAAVDKFVSAPMGSKKEER